MIKDFCPNCEKITTLENIKTHEDLEVRGERINVPVEYLKCTTCGEEVDNPYYKQDSLVLAYKEYRRRHGMVQPQEIREFRQKYGLTQKELAVLLGFGEVTISRYENGALQDISHDTLLRLIKEPSNMLKLVEERGDLLIEDKRQRLIELLSQSVERTIQLSIHNLLEYFGKYKADIFSGFRTFNQDKMFQAILYFCQDGTLKTKLNKLLFYADFLNYFNNSVSITGAKYVHLQYGPVPDNYQLFLAYLVNEGSLNIIETAIYDYTAEMIYSNVKSDLSIFTEFEIITLEYVKYYFKEYTAILISDYAHKEKGYLETTEKEIISYSYAHYLQLLINKDNTMRS
jgi:putative zinc finger/helix-turn-helix YgiT family protein